MSASRRRCRARTESELGIPRSWSIEGNKSRQRTRPRSHRRHRQKAVGQVAADIRRYTRGAFKGKGRGSGEVVRRKKANRSISGTSRSLKKSGTAFNADQETVSGTAERPPWPCIFTASSLRRSSMTMRQELCRRQTTERSCWQVKGGSESGVGGEGRQGHRRTFALEEGR